MKNLFNTLFGNKSNGNAVIEQSMSKADTLTESSLPHVPYHLFVDNNQPGFEEKKMATKKSELNGFLNRNFFSEGFRDGYEFHSVDFFNKNTDALASEFRFLLDKEIQKVKSEISDLKIEVAHLGDRMPALKQALEIKMEEQENFAIEYADHKAMSVDFEGWFSMPIRNYQRGFEAGQTKHLKERNMFGDIGIL